MEYFNNKWLEGRGVSSKGGREGIVKDFGGKLGECVVLEVKCKEND